jgi:hypothetical protein
VASRADNGAMPLNLQYIRQRREQFKLTQAEAAKRAGFPNLQKWSSTRTATSRTRNCRVWNPSPRRCNCSVARL